MIISGKTRFKIKHIKKILIRKRHKDRKWCSNFLQLELMCFWRDIITKKIQNLSICAIKKDKNYEIF